MPNHSSCQYSFANGNKMWYLDNEKTKLKVTINYCKSNLAALEMAKKNELSHLAEKFNDLMLMRAHKGKRDYQLSQKIRQIWDDQDDTFEELDYAEQQLEMIESELSYYMYSTV